MTRTTEREAVTRIPLGGTLVAASASEIRQEWLTAIQVGGDVEVDAADLDGVDTAGLQLLVALRRQVEDTGGRFTLVNAGAGLREPGRLLGLEGCLGLGSSLELGSAASGEGRAGD